MASSVQIKEVEELSFEDELERIRHLFSQNQMPSRAATLALREIAEHRFTVGDVLKCAGRIPVTAVERFVVAEHFKPGSMVGEREIGWVNPVFIEHFYGVAEENVKARDAYVWDIPQHSHDAPIVDALGGAQSRWIETPLSQAFQLLADPDPSEGIDIGTHASYRRSPKTGQLMVVDWKIDVTKLSIACYPHPRLQGWFKGVRIYGG